MSSKPKNAKQPNRTELIEKLAAAGQRLSNETVFFQQAAAERFGLSATDIKTAFILIQTGPMTAGQLAKTLGLTTGAVTSVIDRLENARFVERKGNPDDRRKVVVELVPGTVKKARQVYEPMVSAMRQLNKQYTNQELKIIFGYFEAEANILHSQAVKLRKPTKNKQKVI